MYRKKGVNHQRKQNDFFEKHVFTVNLHVSSEYNESSFWSLFYFFSSVEKKATSKQES